MKLWAKNAKYYNSVFLFSKYVKYGDEIWRRKEVSEKFGETKQPYWFNNNLEIEKVQRLCKPYLVYSVLFGTLLSLLPSHLPTCCKESGEMINDWVFSTVLMKPVTFSEGSLHW